MTNRVYIQDVTLRDGAHAIRHQFTLEQVREVAAALDAAGVDAIEVGHGDGMAGSSVNLGPASHPDVAWISAAAEVVKRAKLVTVLLPGIGTVRDMEAAVDAGISSIRISTHCTEADIGREHLHKARELGLDTSGFLMLTSHTSPEELGKQAKIMEEAGAQCVFVADSAGHLTTPAYRARIQAVRAALSPETEIGVHAHHNLALAVANSLAAVEEGAVRVDASLAGLGAGAGNCPIEAFIAAAQLEGIETGCDLFQLMDAADDLVRPIMADQPVVVNRETITVGYAGIYGSFLRHAETAAQRYGVRTGDIIIEAGRRALVGGQEDMLTDIALDLAGVKQDSDEFVSVQEPPVEP